MTAKTLELEKSGRQVQWFAASLFRLALTAILDLRFSEAVPHDSRGLGRHIATRIDFSQAQCISEMESSSPMNRRREELNGLSRVSGA